MQNIKGFSLTELLVVVAIIGGLAALGIPKYLEIKSEARRAECLNTSSAISSSARIYKAQNNFAPCKMDNRNAFAGDCQTGNRDNIMKFPMSNIDRMADAGKLYYMYNVGAGGRDSTNFPFGWFPDNRGTNKLGVRHVDSSTGSGPFGVNEEYVVTCSGFVAKDATMPDEIKLLSSGGFLHIRDGVSSTVLPAGTEIK